MRVKAVLISLAAFNVQGALSTDIEWTPGDGEKPLPLSKRYREKLEKLEEKVGTEKFKEMTGMAPPSQSTYAASTVGGLALMQGTAKVTTLLLVTAAVAYKVWEHDQKTGFRLPPILLGPEFRHAFASIHPPPRSCMESWLKSSAADAEGDAAAQGDTTKTRVVLGSGPECHRAALATFTGLRFCEGDENAELLVLERRLATLLLKLPLEIPLLSALSSKVNPKAWCLAPFRLKVLDSSGVMGDEKQVILEPLGQGFMPPGLEKAVPPVKLKLTFKSKSPELYEESDESDWVVAFEAEAPTGPVWDSIVGTMTGGLERAVKQEARARAARVAGQSKYQGEADKAYASKMAAQRKVTLGRGDAVANLRFKGGATLLSPKRSR